MGQRPAYPSDLTDAEWAILEPLLPAARADVRPRKYDLREVVNALRYLQRSGCSWRMLPHEFPPYRTVYYYFRVWRLNGTWERVHQQVHEHVRRQAGRASEASAAIADSQSVKTTEKGG